MPYGRRIRAARGWAGLSQRELAERLGVDTQTVKRREAGTSGPRPGELEKVAEVTGVPLGFLQNGWGRAGDQMTTEGRTLAEVQSHRRSVENAVRQAMVNHGRMFEKLDENQELLIKLLQIGTRVDHALSPSAEAQYEQATADLEAHVRGEQQELGAGEVAPSRTRGALEP